MTASTRARSSSACQRGTPWPPIVATARRASRSSTEPGNLMTPTRVAGAGRVGAHAHAEQVVGEPLLRDALEGFHVRRRGSLDDLVGQLRRWRLAVPAAGVEPVANGLLVERGLRPAGVVARNGPEP